MKQISASRTFYFNGENTIYNYTLIFKDNVIENVFNEYGYSIEKSSECFKYFAGL